MSDPSQENVYLLEWSVDPAAPLPLACVLACVQFAPTAIDAGRFRAAGIECPAHIASAVPKRQAEFFHGRLCAQTAMRLLRQDAPQVGIGRMREPLWPADLIGSITHAADMAAALVLPASLGYDGVGIDIETVLSDDGAREVRAVVANDGESRYLATFDEALGPNVPLTLLFSAKESFFKAVHGAVRRYFNFDALELERIDLSTLSMHFRVREDLGPGLRPGARCVVHFRLLDATHAATHVATLCLWRRDVDNA